MANKRLKRYPPPPERVRAGGKVYLFWGLYDWKREALEAKREILKDFQGARILKRTFHGKPHYIVYAR